MDRNLLVIKTLAVIALLMLFGCGENQQAPSPLPVQKAPASSKSVQVPAPEPESVQEDVSAPTYKYEPSGRRDPFEALTSVKRPVSVVEEQMTPLQKYELSQFRLIGVIVGKGEPTAMVVAPDGKSYILKKRIKIGRNDGTVVDITPEAVVVVEKYYDFSGEIRENKLSIELPRRGGVE